MSARHVIVVGGGAAGLLAALYAANAGARVTVLERNEKAGKKIYITGKGRCNVTNTAPRDEFFQNIPRNPRFLYAAFALLDNDGLQALLTSLGLPLKIERGGRVFPASDHASDVTGALTGALAGLGVSVRLNARVAGLVRSDGRVTGVRLADGSACEADAVVVATGGLSYPSTGSTGDGYALAREAGLAVTDTRPSLTAVETVETWPYALTGLTLKNVSLRYAVGKRVARSDVGELLFTHFGVSGPLVLTLSSLLPDEAAGTPFEIDLKPGLSEETLAARVLRDLKASPNRSMQRIAEGLSPANLASALLAQCGVPQGLPANALTQAQRAAYVRRLKAVPLTVKALRGYAEAVITRGGVNVKEINPSTMEAKRAPGLYFAGEVLDIDALTGGFNLQLAFSTGALAGRSAAIGDQG